MKFLRGILALALCLSLCGCGSGDGAGVDLDLTQLSSTMVYAELTNMASAPESYAGKTVKLSGTFSVYVGETQLYYACVVTDSTSCCTQYLEFVPAAGYTYPNDFPAIGGSVTVSGQFSTYEEDGYTYMTLLNATIE